MNPRLRAVLQFGTLVVVAIVLILLFPPAARFAEMAARELRYLWWLILLLAPAVWLVGGRGRRPKP